MARNGSRVVILLPVRNDSLSREQKLSRQSTTFLCLSFVNFFLHANAHLFSLYSSMFSFLSGSFDSFFF